MPQPYQPPQERSVRAPRRNACVTIVVPAFNEEANLGRLLRRIDAAMEQANLACRLIVVDDGSTDNTAAVLAECQSHFPLTVLRHEKNEGLGSTIRDGLLLAAKESENNDIVVTMDADETHTPELTLQMLAAIGEGRDVVIASRYRRGSRTVGVPLIRRFLSGSASLLFRCVFPTPGVRDFTSGYRAYRGGALKLAIASYGDRFVEVDGFQCMVDLLLKLRKLNLVMGEVPLILRYDLKEGETKMRLSKTTFQTLALLARRRLGL